MNNVGKVFIIAEAGVNHNGRMDLAYKLVDSAKEAGADAVKFQAFKAEKLVSMEAQKADYQKDTTDPKESQLEMLRRLQLDEEEQEGIKNYCEKRAIIFLASPFDMESVNFLDGLGLKIFKIPSGEITNLPYLRKIGSLNKEIIMSTGMANMDEVSESLNILIDSGTEKRKITLLHCNTEYPTPYGDVNLLVMRTIKDRLGVNVGYSDHTTGIEVAIGAVALGASVIEKHFTLSKELEGPDHRASLEPGELKEMVIAIRNMELAIGHGEKNPSASELKNKPIVRKSIVAAKPIKKGEKFSEKNITAKRPGTGISPMKWDKIIGMEAKYDFEIDQMIET